MKKLILMWLLFNTIAVIGALFSINVSPDTLFEYPYLHFLGIVSLFALINLPFYTAYDRLKEE